jgi:hypothetical protein
MASPARLPLVLLALAACAADPEPVEHPDAGPLPDAGEPTREYRLRLFEPDGMFLQGVPVCIRERPDLGCVTTDNNAIARVRVPDGDLSLTFSRTTRESMLLPIQTDSTGDISLAMNEEALLAAALSSVGISFPAGPLIVVNLIHDPAVSDTTGATGTISVPATGPVYAQPGTLDSSLDPSLTSATQAGLFVFGDMAEGTVEVTVQHPTLQCTRHPIGGNWAGSTPNSARVPAVNGFDTVVAFVCQ